jgi:hypothetical protein
MPVFSRRWNRRSATFATLVLSRFPVGSSASRSFGSLTMARAIATRSQKNPKPVGHPVGSRKGVP